MKTSLKTSLLAGLTLSLALFFSTLSCASDFTVTINKNEVTITGLARSTDVVIFSDAWAPTDTIWAGRLKKWQKKQFVLEPMQQVLVRSTEPVQVSHPMGFSLNSRYSILSIDNFSAFDKDNCIRLNASVSKEPMIPLRDYLARLSAGEVQAGVKETRNVETLKHNEGKEYFIAGDFYDFHEAGYIYILQGFKNLGDGRTVVFTGTALNKSECDDCTSCQNIDRKVWLDKIMRIIDTYSTE